MIRRFGVATVLLLVLGFTLTPTETQRMSTGKTFTITVASDNPQEVLEFEGAVMASAERPHLELIRGKTPYEYKTTAQVLNAMFKRTAGVAALRVVVRYETEGWVKGESSARAEAVIVTQNLGRKDSSFITGL